MIWSLSVLSQCDGDGAGAKPIRRRKFLAGGEHFTVDTDVLVQTSHPLPRKKKTKNPETTKLLAACYHGIGFQRAPLSSWSVGN